MVVICGVCDLHADLFVCGLLCCVLGMYVVILVAWFVCVWCLFCVYVLCLVNVCLHVLCMCCVFDCGLYICCLFLVHACVCVWVWLLIVLVPCFVIV